MRKQGFHAIRCWLSGALLAAVPASVLASPVTFDVDFSWASNRLTGTITSDDSYAGGDLLNHLSGWSLTVANGLYSGTSNSWEGGGLNLREDARVPVPILYSGAEGQLYLDLRPIVVDGFHRFRQITLTGSSGTTPFSLTAWDDDLPGGGAMWLRYYDPAYASPVLNRTFIAPSQQLMTIGRVAVPEPSAWTLMLACLGGVGFVVSRRRARG